VGHLDGFEENTDPQNLIWNCRACNTRLGVVFKRLGLGRRTRQYNPAQQCATFEGIFAGRAERYFLRPQQSGGCCQNEKNPGQ
jgi:hypothetical protein